MLKVIAQAERLATHSWEYGSLSLALIDWYNPNTSVFAPRAFPNGGIPNLDVNNAYPLAYAKPLIRLNSTTLIEGDGKSTLVAFGILKAHGSNIVIWFRCCG